MSFFGDSSSGRSAHRQILFAGTAITIATVLAYASQWKGVFVLDDIPSISENEAIHDLGHLGRVLFPGRGGLSVSGRPLASLSLAINYAWGGLNPVGYHLVNLMIHVVAAWTLFGIVRRALCLFVPNEALPIAFATALLWAVHPVQTESVTYIVQRTESLMGLFYLLTLYCFIRSVEPAESPQRPPVAWAALSVTCCLLGMATKEVMVSAPLMVLLYDRSFISGTFSEAWRRRRAYYVSMAGCWVPLAAFVMAAGSRGHTSGFNIGVDVVRYWTSQLPVILKYLSLVYWPHKLIFDYGPQLTYPPWKLALSLLFVEGLLIGTVLLLFAPSSPDGRSNGRMHRAAGFAGAWFFILLAPTSLIPGNRQIMAEHRIYLSLAAVLALTAFAVFRILRKRIWLFPAFAVAWGSALTARTYQRNKDYRSDLALYQGVVSEFPESYMAHCELGSGLFDAGRWEEAKFQYEMALRLNPSYSEAHDNLGLYYFEKGNMAEAIGCYRRALAVDPGNPQAHNNLGVALANRGDRAEAMNQYRQAIALKPHYPEAYDNLGNLEYSNGRIDAAIAAFSTALRQDPDNGKAASNLGVALVRIGHLDQALVQFERTVRLRPDFAEGQNNLGLALMLLGRSSQALPHFDTAIRLRPDYVNAHRNRAKALSELGQSAAAASENEIARRLQSKN